MASKPEKPKDRRIHETPKELPAAGFLRFKQIVPGLIPVSRATWYAGVKSGRYPKPRKLGKRATGWTVEEIKALIAGHATA